MDTLTLGTASPARRSATPHKFTPEYPPEFRAEAVRLVRNGGLSISTAAKDLGVSTEPLRHWVKQDALESGQRKDGLTSDERKELVRMRRENRDPREDHEILISRGLLCQGEPLDPVAVFAFIEREKANHEVNRMCRLLQVTRQGYYSWRRRPTCKRKLQDAYLSELVISIHHGSCCNYGWPRIWTSCASTTACAAAASGSFV